MIYDTHRQSDKVEDELMNLAVLGLLEIKGQVLLKESEELNKTAAVIPGENNVRFLEKEIHRKERAEKFLRMGKKLSPFITRAAVIFMVLCFSTGSVLVVSADAREFLYKLLISQHERYMVIEADQTENDHFDSLEEYQQAGAKYAPTYIPPGISLQYIDSSTIFIVARYQSENSDSPFLNFLQHEEKDSISIRIDSESADIIETIQIGNSEAVLIVKNGKTKIAWYAGDTMFSVFTDLSTEEAIKFAKGLKNI